MNVRWNSMRSFLNIAHMNTDLIVCVCLGGGGGGGLTDTRYPILYHPSPQKMFSLSVGVIF